MQETFYLLQSPENARRLLKGIEEYEAGGGQEKDLFNENDENQ